MATVMGFLAASTATGTATPTQVLPTVYEAGHFTRCRKPATGND